MSINSQLIQTLGEAVKGLFFESEMDYPVENFFWENSKGEDVNSANILRHSGKSPDTPVEEMLVDDFFAPAVAEEDWYEEEEMENSKRFRELLKVLKLNLSDIKVFKTGSIDMDVYVVGRTKDGYLAGLRTRVVET
jgi:hypothetical protein